MASATRSLGSEYTADRVGYCPTACARSSICSGAVRYAINLYAAAGDSLYALMASCAPPRVAVEWPPASPDAGIGDTANFPATRDEALSLIAPTAYGQFRMNAAVPF